MVIYCWLIFPPRLGAETSWVGGVGESEERKGTLVENRPFVSAPFSELLPAFFEPGSEGDLIPAIPSSRE